MKQFIPSVGRRKGARNSTAGILSSLPDKRCRRTKAQIVQLRDQIVAVLKGDHPQSVRHLFYRMTDPRLPEPVDKTEDGYAQVQHQIAQMRREGAIPYKWISDTTRRGWFVHTFDGAGDFIRRMTGLYRAVLWRDSQTYVECWCESRSIAGVIQGDCTELAVSLYPAGGFTSMTLAFEAAQQIRDIVDQTGKTVRIIYVGDYDPAGVLIDRDIEAKLRDHLGDEIDLEFERIAINADQIDAYDLPTKPRKASDRRALHIKKTVEAEAMPAHILRKLLRKSVESYLPRRALSVAKAAEKSERACLARVADLLEVGTESDAGATS